jgi:hypothetical protein
MAADRAAIATRNQNALGEPPDLCDLCLINAYSLKVVLIVTLRLAGSAPRLGNPRHGAIAFVRGAFGRWRCRARGRSLGETTSKVGLNAL